MDFVLTCLGPFLIANTRDEKVPLTGTVKVKFANEERIGRDRMLDSLALREAYTISLSPRTLAFLCKSSLRSSWLDAWFVYSFKAVKG